MPTRVLVWNEGRHEKRTAQIAEIYPEGIHGAIAAHLRKDPTLQVDTAVMDDFEHGLTQQRVDQTDVFIWWGHLHHDKIDETVIQRVHARVLHGAGFIALHSAHMSRIFQRLMGATCNLKWREHKDEREILWVTRPGHPCVAGIDDHFILPHEEMYGEFFDIPEPECTFLISSFTGGEVFRSGCAWTRGAGRVVYFRPGHETFPTYHDPNVLRVIANAVRFSAPAAPIKPPEFGKRPNMGWMG